MDSKRVFDVVGLNGLDYDMVLAVDHLPRHDEKISVRLVGNLPGGPVGNFACAASRLGLRVAVAARLGQDVHADAIISELTDYGVDTGWIRQDQHIATSFTVILVDPSGERAILVVEPAAGELSGPGMEIPEVIFQAQYLYLTIYSYKPYSAWLPKIRQRGVKVMIDIENTKQALDIPLQIILENCDIASFNRAGFQAFTQHEPDLSVLDALIEENPCDVILATLGSDGVLGASRVQKAVHIPGFVAPVKDTTGAGDTFNAAFLAAKLRNLPLTEALRFAAAASAISVTSIGPKGKLPVWPEVSSFLKQQMIG